MGNTSFDTVDVSVLMSVVMNGRAVKEVANV
jgi:hypothetical protein